MDQELKKRILHRAKITRGQFDALINAVEQENYCVDIFTQSLAIQKSLRSLNKLVLQNHLQTHVKQGLETGSTKAKEKLLEELLRLYELNNVRG